MGNPPTWRFVTRIHYKHKMVLLSRSGWQKNTIYNTILKHGPSFKDIYPLTSVEITSMKWTKKHIRMNRTVQMTLLALFTFLWWFSGLWSNTNFSSFWSICIMQSRRYFCCKREYGIWEVILFYFRMIFNGLPIILPWLQLSKQTHSRKSFLKLCICI